MLQVLVFSTMTRLLDIVEDHLNWRGIEHLRLDGSTASAERGELVRCLPYQPHVTVHWSLMCEGEVYCARALESGV